MRRRIACALVIAVGLIFFTVPPSIAEPPARPGGKPTRIHALTHAHLIPEPGRVIEDGTVVIRDGIITAVGVENEVRIPPDARVWDLGGSWVYPGLIEPHLWIETQATSKAGEAPSPPPPTNGAPIATGAAHPNPRVRADLNMANELVLPSDLRTELRAAGFTTALAVPARGIFRGTSAVVNLGDGTPNEEIVRADVAAHLAFEHGGEDDDGYPGSLMGAIAVIRQTLLDAEHHAAAMADHERKPGGRERPETNRALESLEPVLSGRRPVAIEAEDAAMILRAIHLTREFKLDGWVVAGGADEYKTLDTVRSAGLGLVTTLNFPAPPVWEGEDEALGIELETLRHWELAPSNPGRLHTAEVPFSFTTQGLTERVTWRERVRAAIARGLPPDVALAALTVEPAGLLGIEDRLGTLATGKIANLTIADGDLFSEDSILLEVWIDGERYEPEPALPRDKDLVGTWHLTLTREDGGASAADVRLRRENGVLLAELVAVAPPDTTPLRHVALERGRLELLLPGGVAGAAGREILVDGEIREKRKLAGKWNWAPIGTGDDIPGLPVVGQKERKPDPRPPETLVTASAERFPPLPEPAPAAVMVRNATIWTAGPDGILEGADLIVANGKVVAVGRGLSAPRDALVIDGAGKHVTPGIIDAHSHSAISGGVNEGTRSSTAEVRIGDVIDPETVDIYRQLAGGVTASHQLHGSANVIGGQDAVIKHRWGANADELLLASAPPGIKFALGENVKQSNWGDRFTTRYPQTRMGVESWFRDRFLAARDYEREWQEWRDKKKGPAPARDLGLEALAEVLGGERLVHCHAYRQDEILMLIRLADEFGFQVASFDHGLECYKVANEVAAHGASVASFSDWWAFKFEVYDAIPYNAAILLNRGAVVTMKSDSSELARRLNSEAGKATKYGGVPAAEAIKFVTLNAARQIGIADRTGSLEPGKDGDFAIWNAPPLSSYARCEETWIEGRRFFSRELDLAARPAAEAERQALLARAQSARGAQDARNEKPAWQPTFRHRFGESATDRRDVDDLRDDLDTGSEEN